MRLLSILTAMALGQCAFSAVPTAKKALNVSNLFSNQMVMQQKKKTAFWGDAAPGTKLLITATWGRQVSATADEKGKWAAKLSTPGAGGPYVISIQTADTTISIKDVLIGEVWLASGQSNMDISVSGWPPGDTIANSKQEIANANYPEIRFFKVPFGILARPSDCTEGKWIASSPQTTGNFSATAYFYARQLYQKLHVPIGIIQSSIGGTPAEAWTSKAGLEKLGDFNEVINNLDTLQRAKKLNSNTPTVLFNAMVNPLIPYTIKGIIWYQGESNVGRAEQYKKLFPLMIEDWRNRWGEKLPFYYVQIAPYLYPAADQKEQSQKLRDAQRYALKLPKTGMVTTLDIGYLKTAHPPYKQEVGKRLAAFALKNEYGETALVASGPLYKKTTAKGNEIIVDFESIGSGLLASDKGLFNFEIAGADKVYLKANAKIKDNKVVVSNDAVPNPVYVRYAWSDGSSASLFNKEGLPAATFISEGGL
jgi:sialate O-acetylesterase